MLREELQSRHRAVKGSHSVIVPRSNLTCMSCRMHPSLLVKVLRADIPWRDGVTGVRSDVPSKRDHPHA